MSCTGSASPKPSPGLHTLGDTSLRSDDASGCCVSTGAGVYVRRPILYGRNDSVYLRLLDPYGNTGCPRSRLLIINQEP